MYISTAVVTKKLLHRSYGAVGRRLAALASLVCLAYGPVQAQAPNWNWATASTESGPIVVEKVTTDAGGNGYVTGRFSKQAHFGSFALQSRGSSDVFVAKVSAEGQWQWAVAAGSVQADRAAGIAVNDKGEVLIAGSFSEEAHFGPLAAQSKGGLDIFVARLSSAGKWLSVATAGGTGQDQAFALALDARQNAIVGGSFRGATNFGEVSLQSNSHAEAFIAKLSPKGKWQWASQSVGTANSQTVISRVAVDQAGAVYAAGYVEGDTRVGSKKMVSAGAHDAFVAKIDEAGAWQWATQGGGESTDYAKGISVSADGTVAVTGTFSGTAAFGAVELTSQGGDDAYVAQLSTQGEWQWVYQLKGSALEDGADICQGPNETIYVTGSFSTGAEYGLTPLMGKGGMDLYVARFSKSGRCLDVLSAGSISEDMATTIALALNGDIYVGGKVGVATTFGPHQLGDFTPQAFIGRVQFSSNLMADKQ